MRESAYPVMPPRPGSPLELEAYPVPEAGMSLRERVAIEALGGLLAHRKRYKPRPLAMSDNWHYAICEEAFEIADAFIQVREHPDETPD